MKNKLTVVVPVYNGERTLEALLQSLFSSGRSHFELVAVNDGSTDRTQEILDRYGVKTVPLEKNSGIAHARNLGIGEAQTPYVAFVDADCVVQEEWCRRILEEFERLREKHPGTAAMSGKVLPYEEHSVDLVAAYVEHWEYQNGNRPEERCKLSTSHCICDAEILRKIGKFDETLTVDEDRELGLRMQTLGHKVFYNPNLAVRHHHARKTLLEIFRHQFFWGEKTGLVNEWRYRKIRKLWFLSWIKHPVPYLLLMPALCLFLTLRIIRQLWLHDKRVLGLSPYILAAKLCYRIGVLKWILKNP